MLDGADVAGSLLSATSSRAPTAMCHLDCVQLDVLHVLSTDLRRGAEMFGFDLHRALLARGVQSDICCLEPGSDGRQRLPVPALGRSRFSFAGLRALRRRASTARVVVAHGSSTLLACGIGLAGTGRPFVYVSIGDPRYWAGTRLRRWRAGWLIRRAAGVVAISPGAREVLLSHYGLAKQKVHVVPNGRPSDRFAPAGQNERLAAREALGLPAAGSVIAIIGALSPEKRVDVAIAAVARIPGAHLVVAGDGPERATLEAQAERSAGNCVHFLGATTGPERVLAASDVLVLSSDSEGVPGVLIEAGLSGLPVVATDVGWVRDVVRPGVTGLLVSPRRPDQLAEAVRQALESRDKLGRGGREHCLAEFEMGPVTDKWQRMLADLSPR